MLAQKLDILAVSDTVLRALTRNTFGESTAAPAKSKSEVKATADLFETVIGAYYLDHGFEALYDWVKEIYDPLIKVTAKTFHARYVGFLSLTGPRISPCLWLQDGEQV